MKKFGLTAAQIKRIGKARRVRVKQNAGKLEVYFPKKNPSRKRKAVKKRTTKRTTKRATPRKRKISRKKGRR